MSTITFPYLGVPGAMQQLPGANGTFDTPSDPGIAATKLLSGGTGIFKSLNPKRSFVLPYMGRPGTGLAELLAAFEDGVFGAGPFVFVDPSVVNVLTLDVSTAGVRTNAGTGWAPFNGTLTRVAGGATGAAATQAGALAWSGMIANGNTQPPFSTLTTPVCLPNEATTFSVWLKASVSVGVSLRLQPWDVTGAVIGSGVSTAVTLTTSWARYSLTVAAGGFDPAAAYLNTAVFGPSSTGKTVYVGAAQMEYGTSATPWQRGYGAPRVQLSAPIGRSAETYGWTTHTLTLAEV